VRRILVLLAACAAGSLGRAAAVGFELSASTSTVMLGAPVEISGSALVPAGSVLTLALSEPSTGPFELLESQVGAHPEAAPAGQQRIPIRLKVAAFELGALTFPPLPWRLKASGGAQESITSPPVPLTVVPPESAKTALNIRDIKGPLSPSAWPWILAALAVLCAVLYPLHRMLRAKGRSPEQAAGPPDTRTPEQKALDDLDALPALGLPVKEFYDRVSDILRLYLSRRYGVDALQMTTHDLLRALRDTADSDAARMPTKALLDRCDLAKFARYAPADSERQRDLEAAKDIVRRSARAQSASAAP